VSGFGSTVKEQIDSGLRGRELADAIKNSPDFKGRGKGLDKAGRDAAERGRDATDGLTGRRGSKGSK